MHHASDLISLPKDDAQLQRLKNLRKVVFAAEAKWLVHCHSAQSLLDSLYKQSLRSGEDMRERTYLTLEHVNRNCEGSMLRSAIEYGGICRSEWEKSKYHNAKEIAGIVSQETENEYLYKLRIFILHLSQEAHEKVALRKLESDQEQSIRCIKAISENQRKSILESLCISFQRVSWVIKLENRVLMHFFEVSTFYHFFLCIICIDHRNRLLLLWLLKRNIFPKRLVL